MRIEVMLWKLASESAFTAGRRARIESFRRIEQVLEAIAVEEESFSWDTEISATFDDL